MSVQQQFDILFLSFNLAQNIYVSNIYILNCQLKPLKLLNYQIF